MTFGHRYARVRRGAGFCGEPYCNQNGKAIFLLSATLDHRCHACGQKGFSVEERGWSEGPEGAPFRKAVVLFDYDPQIREFAARAEVADTSLPADGSCRTFFVQTPIVSMQRTALAMAESYLASVQINEPPGDGGLPDRLNLIVDFDKGREEVWKALEGCGRVWERVFAPRTG